MKTIFKYWIEPKDFSNFTTVNMPHDAKILTIGNQGNEIFVWAEVDTDSTVSEKMFEVFGTGQEIKSNMGTEREYLGTAFLENCLVFHVYEIKN